MHRLVFVALVTLAACSEYVHAECTDGWVVFGGSCYLFSIENTHFTEAEHFCTQHQSHVVHVETGTEDKFLKSHLSQLKDGNWWMGLTDQIIEDIWRWYDTDELVTYTDWYPGQLDGGHGENCAIYYYPFGYAWADVACDRSFHPICERSTQKPLLDNGSCG